MITGGRVGSALRRWATEAFLTVRSLFFLGGQVECPCCGGRFRSFTHGGGSFRTRENGYCPRCNAKARHRRVWRYLCEHTDLETAALRILHVSPHFSLGRRLRRMHNIEYAAVDLEPGPHVSRVCDVTDLPFPDAAFDGIICVHVLEHVERDDLAISEMIRVLEPGGWILIDVPLMLDRVTYEDATIVTPQARREAFGEAGHVRVYGTDLVQRLEASGLMVELDRGTDVDLAAQRRNGLMADEHLLFGRKLIVDQTW